MREVDGGVELVGRVDLVERANLVLRLPTRVLLRLGEVEARDFARLRRGVAALPLRRWLAPGKRVSIRAAASRSRLYHTGAIAEQVALALHESAGLVDDDQDEEAFSVLVRGQRDLFTVSLDTSGDRLHQRGWREAGGKAPLRETLAAALLTIAAPREDEPFLDPMCGSGTLPIEAALRRIGRAPGLDRRFAFERFVNFDAAAWRRLREEARARERPRPLPIVGADADPAQLELATANAARAGVAELIRFRLAAVATQQPPERQGLLVANLPYGRRVGVKREIPALYREVGQLLRGPFAEWRAAFLVEDRALLPTLGADAERAIPLSNGGLRVWVGLRG